MSKKPGIPNGSMNILSRSQNTETAGMRVLLVPSSYAPKIGGLETATAHLGAELVRRGHSVTVITNRYPRTLRAYEMIDGIPVHRILMTNLWLSGRHLTRLAKYVVGLALAPI